jgi:hypothetical protein
MRLEQEQKLAPGGRVHQVDKTYHRPCPDSMIEKMSVQRHSYGTIKVYQRFFEEFINYYPTRPVEEITEKEIIATPDTLVTERAVSQDRERSVPIRTVPSMLSSFTMSGY